MKLQFLQSEHRREMQDLREMHEVQVEHLQNEVEYSKERGDRYKASLTKLQGLREELYHLPAMKTTLAGEKERLGKGWEMLKARENALKRAERAFERQRQQEKKEAEMASASLQKQAAELEEELQEKKKDVSLVKLCLNEKHLHNLATIEHEKLQKATQELRQVEMEIRRKQERLLRYDES